ncbi:universal stress protein [Candidatus Bathyarchaeota archaeon]|nr:universal stress protein [Candidatus Bathyarchaeota archaeon]
MISKILVAVDGSEPSLNALDYAAEFADSEKAELTILSVVPNLPPMAVEGFTPEYIPQYQEELEESYIDLLNEHEKRLNERFPDLEIVTIVRMGSPGKIIVESAQAREVDLIIVGNRGQSGIITWMLGSVSRYVVDSCTVPVLVVKDEEFCRIKD